MVEYVTRVEQYSIYIDQNQLYVEAKEDEFAAVFDLPPAVKDADDKVSKLKELVNDGYFDMTRRVQKTHGRISDERVPEGLPVRVREKQDGDNTPVEKPPREPGPPEWAGPNPGEGLPNEPAPPVGNRPEVTVPVEDES